MLLLQFHWAKLNWTTWIAWMSNMSFIVFVVDPLHWLSISSKNFHKQKRLSMTNISSDRACNLTCQHWPDDIPVLHRQCVLSQHYYLNFPQLRGFITIYFRYLKITEQTSIALPALYWLCNLTLSLIIFKVRQIVHILTRENVVSTMVKRIRTYKRWSICDGICWRLWKLSTYRGIERSSLQIENYSLNAFKTNLSLLQSVLLYKPSKIQGDYSTVVMGVFSQYQTPTTSIPTTIYF